MTAKKRKRAPGGGRPKILMPCPWCGQTFGSREFRDHAPTCRKTHGWKSLDKFDITDGSNRYAPCPKCGAVEGMGLTTQSGQLAVQCRCGFRGPSVSNRHLVADDEAAFRAWNALPVTPAVEVKK